MYNTKFYELLNKASTDETAMVLVIDKIFPLLNKYSRKYPNEEIDEDLKSFLIEYTIKLLKNKDFADNLSRKNLNSKKIKNFFEKM